MVAVVMQLLANSDAFYVIFRVGFRRGGRPPSPPEPKGPPFGAF